MSDIQISSVNQGVSKIIHYDNIAIVVLFLCLLFSLFFNFVQWKHRNKSDELIVSAMNALREALGDLKTTIAILNERIVHNDTSQRSP